MRKREAQYFGISGFGIPRLQKPNIKHKQFFEMRKRESGSRISGFREFGLQGFGVSSTQTPHTTIPEFRKQQDVGSTASRFWVLGFRDLQTHGA
jgi:hypothetical protein